MQNFSFNYVPRVSNGVAHCVARFGLGIHDSLVWFEDSPDNALSETSSSKTLLIFELMLH